jgi:hypothetical protein
MTRSGVEE